MSTSKSLASTSVLTSSPVAVATPASTPAVNAGSDSPHIVALVRAFRAHPATRDKSPKGLGSKCAVLVNRATSNIGNNGAYFTGADILALCERNAINIGG